MAQTIKALSLWSPWGQYIAMGHKKYETRSFSVSYRGLVAIHSAKRWTDEEQEAALALHRRFPAIPLIQNPILGAVLCICRLLNCVRTESISHSISAHERAVGGWAEGRYAWELEVLEVFDTPIPAKGQQGLFDWEIPQTLLEKRIAIVGSRDYLDLDAVKRYVYSLPKDVTIISGGARGVDTVAVDTAKERGMKTVVVPVNQRNLPEGGADRTNLFAQRAMIRNGEIVQLVGSVTAFWDEKSNGTRNSIERAEKAGKPVIINPNVVTPEAAPKQLKLELHLGTYDERAYIAALEKGGRFSPQDEKRKQPDFVWEWPWMASQDDVWVKAKGDVAYKLVPKNSAEVAAWASVLNGWVYSAETQSLREWLKAQADNFIPLPCDHFELNRYAIDDALHAIKDSDIQYAVLPVEKLTFTQATYNPGICLKYLESGTIREFESGLLPMVYQFRGDERYFLSNGSHRGIAWLMGLDPKRRAAMPVRLARIPHSLEALYEQVIEVDEDEDERLEFIADVLAEALKAIREAKELERELVTA